MISKVGTDLDVENWKSGKWQGQNGIIVLNFFKSSISLAPHLPLGLPKT
jgi:hypothetical protein